MKRYALGAVIGAVLAVSTFVTISAHVTFISPYTFNQHVAPILRERCGACHGEHTPGRALLDFEQAQLHEVEIARSVMVGRMPPWSAEAGAAAFKGDQTLTPREVDVLMTWTAGGMPQGPANATAIVTPPIRQHVAPRPAPDLVLQMPSAFVFDGSPEGAVHEEVFAAKAARGRAIRAVDIEPGDPSVVRRAEVAIRTRRGDRTIGLWVPGDTPQTLEANAAYAVPRGASIVLRVHYARPPAGKSELRSDRTQVDLFFSAERHPPDPRDLVIEDDGPLRFDQPRVVSQPVVKTVRALALRPISGPVDAVVTFDIVGADGQRQPLARLQLRAKWPRRYIFASPVTLPAGARIEARVTRRDPFVWAALTGDEGIPAHEAPLRIAFEVIN